MATNIMGFFSSFGISILYNFNIKINIYEKININHLSNFLINITYYWLIYIILTIISYFQNIFDAKVKLGPQSYFLYC